MVEGVWTQDLTFEGGKAMPQITLKILYIKIYLLILLYIYIGL